jgi:MFS-type transporter involved in bile tolerance (Atg22 family)
MGSQVLSLYLRMSSMVVLWCFITRIYLSWLRHIQRTHPTIVCSSLHTHTHTHTHTLLYNSVREAINMGADNAIIARLTEQTSHHLSSYGVACGFAGALCHLLVGVGMLVGMSNQLTGARMVVALCGLWSLIFAIPMMLYVKTRDGAPLPVGYSYFNISWRTLKSTLATRKDLPHTFRFLASYFLYSDAVSTIVSGSAVFAVAELQMSMTGIVFSLLEVALIATISGVVASMVRSRWPTVMKPKRVIMTCLVCLTVIPLAGLVAITHQYEYYILSAWYVYNLPARRFVCFASLTMV